MQAVVFIDEPLWDRHHQRLASCIAFSALALFLVIVTLDWPTQFDFSRLIPLELEVTVSPAPDRQEPELRKLSPPQARPVPRTESRPLSQTDAQPLQEPVAPAAEAKPQAPAAPAEQPDVVTPQPATGEAPVDWYVELEMAAAAVGARAAEEVRSLHPEFDELRRVAAERYGKPSTNPPAPSWQAEEDPSGRTLLRRGNSYMVLDDPNVTNRYAFETFERHTVFFTVPLGKRRPQNLPWVEAIRSRYDYMLDRDELPPLKQAPTQPSPE